MPDPITFQPDTPAPAPAAAGPITFQADQAPSTGSPISFTPDEPAPDTGIGWKALGEGALAGAIPGGPKLLETVGGPSLEEQAKSKEEFPKSFGVGEFAGNLGQLAAVSAIPGVGEAEAPTMLAKMAASGLTFGAQNVSNTINERELGDPEANSESLVNQFGLGALTGAIAEPAFALAKEIIPNPITLMSKAAAKVSDAATDFLAKFAPVARGELAQEVGAETLTQAVKNVGEEAVKGGGGGVAAAQRAANASAENLADGLTKLNEKYGNAVKSFYEDLRPDQVDSHLNPISFGASKPLAQQYVDSTLGTGLAQLQKAAESGIIDSGVVNDVTERMQRFQNAFESSRSTADIYRAGKDAAQEIADNVMRYDRVLGQTGEEAKTMAMVEQQLMTPLRKFIASPEIFGVAHSAAELAANEAYTDAKKAMGALYKQMGYTDLIADGRPGVKAIKDSKVQNFAKAIAQGKLTATEAQGYLENALQKVKQFGDVAVKAASDAGKTYDPAELQDVLKDVVQRRNASVAAQGLAWKPVGQGAVSSIKGAVVAHALGLGSPLAVGAAVAGQQIFNTFKNPAVAAEMFGTVKRIADKQLMQIGRGISRAISSQIPRQAIEQSITRGVLDGDRSFKAGALGKKEQDSFTQRTNEIRNLISNPTLLQYQLTTNTARLGDAEMPLHAQGVQNAAMARLKVLAAVLPPVQPSGILPQDRHAPDPDPEAVAAFERTYAVVTDPVGTLLGATRDETLSQDMVDAAAQASPHTLAQIRKVGSEKLAALPKSAVLSYGQRQAWTTLLGTPVSDDQEPLQVAFQQQNYAPPPPQGPPPGGNGAPKRARNPRTAGVDKLHFDQDLAFGAQRIQNERKA